MFSLTKATKIRTAVTVGLLIVATALSSTYPLVFKLADGEANFLLFYVVFQFVIVSGNLVWFFIYHRQWIKDRSLWRLLVQNFKTGTGIIAIISFQASALFLLAAVFVEVAVVNIITELGTIFFVFFMAKKVGGNQYQRPSLGKYLLFGLTFIGVALVVLSQFGLEGFGGQNPLQYSFGLLLALATAIFCGLEAYNFKLADRFCQQATKAKLLSAPKQVQKTLKTERRVFSLRLVSTAIDGASLLVVMAIYYFHQGNLVADIVNHSTSALFLTIGCAVICLLAWFVWQKALLVTTNLDINMIGYLGPILAVFWLSLFNLADVESLKLLWLGSSLVVGANILIGLSDLKKFHLFRLHFRSLFPHRN